MSELPPESDQLLAVAPDDFVAARKRLEGELREAGRSEEAAAVASLRKPSAVVLAANRAARDRPKVAKAAAKAARDVEKAQVGGDAEAFRTALAALDDSLDLLGEVAVAHVARSGRSATETMRRRVHDLLRRAAASEETRDRLSRGALLEEQEATGFSSLTGPVEPAVARKRSAPARVDTRAKRKQEERRERRRALRAELEDAERALRDAERATREAERDRERAARAVSSLRQKLERLESQPTSGR